MNNVKQRFELQIRHLFAEEELSGLMDVCMHDGELSERQAQVLAVLLHNTPKTVVSHHLGFEDLI